MQHESVSWYESVPCSSSAQEAARVQKKQDMNLKSLHATSCGLMKHVFRPLSVSNHIKIHEVRVVNSRGQANLSALISMLQHHTSVVTRRTVSARAGCNETIDVLYQERRQP